MSRLHYSFNGPAAAALAAEKPVNKAAAFRAKVKRPDRRYLKSAIENIGLFALGFGSTCLLIHFVAGFHLAARLSGRLPFLIV
jgi:hypothetical protein